MTDQQAQDNFENTKRNDLIKREFCLNNNIQLVEIPYWNIKHIGKILIDKLGE